MKPRTTYYFDWFEDIEPEILKNLNEILVDKGIEPMNDHLYGGFLKDGKWVSVSEGGEYRNYWHIFVGLWGEEIRNDHFVNIYFPDDEEGLEYCREKARKQYGEWAVDLVDAVEKTVHEHNELIMDYSANVWFSW